MYKLRFYDNQGNCIREEYFSTLEDTARRWGADYSREKADRLLTPTAWESTDNGETWIKIRDAVMWELSVGRESEAKAEAEARASDNSKTTDHTTKAPYSACAHTTIAAIKTLASKPENLANLESYLSYNFGAWLAKFANTPETIACELKEFANMEI